jgi:hypothetical protein
VLDRHAHEIPLPIDIDIDFHFALLANFRHICGLPESAVDHNGDVEWNA